MKKLASLIFVAALFLLSRVAVAGSAEIDKPAPPFALKSSDGQEYSFENLKGKPAVVLMFISTRCPYSNAYNERMARLYADYNGKGVVFLGIYANGTESLEDIKQHAQDKKFAFPILKDEGNVVADLYGAQVTPETFVLDAGLTLRYHGRIDNSHKTDEVKTQDLRAALDAVLTAGKVANKETKAFGCSIKRVKKDSD